MGFNHFNNLTFFYYGLKYFTIGLGKFLGLLLGKNFIPLKKSIKAVEVISNDEEFKNELAKIIKNEGDFNEFIKNTKAPGGRDYYWNDIMIKGFQNYKILTSDIVEKLLMTEVIEKYIKINNLSKKEIQFIGDSLFYFISSESFRKEALKIRNKLYPEMEEDFFGNIVDSQTWYLTWYKRVNCPNSLKVKPKMKYLDLDDIIKFFNFSFINYYSLKSSFKNTKLVYD